MENSNLKRLPNELWTGYLVRRLKHRGCKVEPIEIEGCDADQDTFWVNAGTELDTGKGRVLIRRMLDFKDKLSSSTYNQVMRSKPYNLSEWIYIMEDTGSEFMLGIDKEEIDTLEEDKDIKILSKYNSNFKGDISEIFEDIIEYVKYAGFDKLAIKKRNQRRNLSSKLKNPVKINKFEIPEEFVQTESGNYFGFIKKDYAVPKYIEDIVQEGENKSMREGWKIKNTFVKKLGKNEMENFPAKRFINSLNLHKPFINSIPEPIGLIYSGNWVNLASGNSDCYFIAENIEGDNLYRIFEKLNKSEKEHFFKVLGNYLEDIRRHDHLYLMDFAPRDIVYNANGLKQDIKLVDTEHVESVGNLILKRGEDTEAYLLQKQISQFKGDYKSFLGKKELENSVKQVFGKN